MLGDWGHHIEISSNFGEPDPKMLKIIEAILIIHSNFDSLYSLTNPKMGFCWIGYIQSSLLVGNCESPGDFVYAGVSLSGHVNSMKHVEIPTVWRFRKPKWNLNIMVSNRNFLFKGLLFSFHVSW